MVGPPTSSKFTTASHGQLEMPLVEGMDLVVQLPEQVSTLVLVGPCYILRGSPGMCKIPQHYNNAVFFVQLRKFFLTKTLH